MSTQLRTIAQRFLNAFHEDPGHSDLDREQPIHITVTLGDLRDLRWALSAASETRQSEPPKGLLVSIALRLDHGLFLPGFAETEEEHKRRVQSALADARRAWEECSGNGFWSPERNAAYEEGLSTNSLPRLT
jgi:hypothetical protein